MKKINTIVSQKLYNISLQRKGLILANIITYWQDIIGSQFYSQTYPFSIKSYNINKEMNKILYIKARNDSVATTAMYHQDIIVYKTNFILGYQCINKIKIYSDPDLW